MNRPTAYGSSSNNVLGNGNSDLDVVMTPPVTKSSVLHWSSISALNSKKIFNLSITFDRRPELEFKSPSQCW